MTARQVFNKKVRFIALKFAHTKPDMTLIGFDLRLQSNDIELILRKSKLVALICCQTPARLHFHGI